jgi:hypothetical protein
LSEGVRENVGKTFYGTEDDKVFEGEAESESCVVSLAQNDPRRMGSKNSRIDVTIQLESETTIGTSLVLNSLHGEDRLLARIRVAANRSCRTRNIVCALMKRVDNDENEEDFLFRRLTKESADERGEGPSEEGSFCGNREERKKLTEDARDLDSDRLKL